MSGDLFAEGGDMLTRGVLGRRILAWWIDAAAIGAIAFGLSILLGMIGVATLGASLGLFAILPFVPGAYHFVSLVSAASATPGQQLCGLVVRRAADLGPPGPWRAAIAVAGYYLTLATFGLLLVVCLFERRRRTLHDLASGLVVARQDAYEALTAPPGFWNMGR